jgi:hypothetical protein
MSSPGVGHYRLEANTVMDIERLDHIPIFVENFTLHTRGFRVVSGLKRLLKLSARITACKTSSSSFISLSVLLAMPEGNNVELT